MTSSQQQFKMYQSLLLLILISLCTVTACNKYVYHFIKEEKNWTEAVEFCRTHYTDLVTVDENTNVTTICPNTNGCGKAWVNNCKCQHNNTEWRWVLCDNMYNKNEANWKNNATNNDMCAYVQKKPNESFTWYSGLCSASGRYVCYNDKLAKFTQSRDEKNWTDALDYCRNNNQIMVNGHDMLKNDEFIGGIEGTGEYIKWWIGLYRCPLSWSQGSDAFPNKDLCCGSQEDKCVIIDGNNSWHKENCTETHPFLCYEDLMVLVNKNMTWEEALLYCRRNHGDLAIMTDDHQQTIVQKKAEVAQTDFVWVGLYYISFFQEWVWVNGQWVSSSDRNWENYELNNCSVSGAMQKGGNKWVKRPSGERHNFVCTVSS